ncbi:hypothetical protein STAQ_29190 [Allostella sp. ATCC 35155]|nr:hypothetical protein STAQ_29190 [Stella sp. ATCC 35155]
MTIPGRSWIVPASLALLLVSGCSTVEQVAGVFGGSDKPEAPPAGAQRSFVGERAEALQGDLARLQQTRSERAEAAQRLKGQATAESAAYNGTVQDIAERLQDGAGALDPKLLGQWTEARSHLARVDEVVARMRALEADLAADRARGRFLADTARNLATVGGAGEADAARARQVQAGLAESAAGLDAVGTDLAAEIRRHTEWLTTERQRSDTLLAAVRSGTTSRGAPAAGRAAPLAFAGPAPDARPAPGVRAAPEAAPPARATPARAAPEPAPARAAAAGFTPKTVDGRKPFVAVRFADKNPQYEPALYEALKVAVDRNPAIRFDVVAVTPKGGKVNSRTTMAYAEQVAGSMRKMGLSKAQARTYGRSQDGLDAPQVHVYVRRR